MYEADQTSQVSYNPETTGPELRAQPQKKVLDNSISEETWPSPPHALLCDPEQFPSPLWVCSPIWDLVVFGWVCKKRSKIRGQWPLVILLSFLSGGEKRKGSSSHLQNQIPPRGQ